MSPDTCGWHYVEGLRKDDDPRLALFWDKVGLGHNGERLNGGGHIVTFVDGFPKHIPESEWTGFLDEQESCLPISSGPGSLMTGDPMVKVTTMPLFDDFRPPLSVRRHWPAFHNAWATFLASHLNQFLPEGYFAEPNVQFGIEIHVAVPAEGDFYVAESAAGWMVPIPTQTVPVAIVSDVVEVQVYDREGGPVLAGAIELVSPTNKDRPEHRAAFATK